MRGLPILCAVAVLLLVSSGARCEPAKIRISWVAVPNNLPPLFMSKPEMMKHAGTSYTVDPIRFPGTPQSVAALASGDLDIALLTFSSFPLAIQNAGLQDLRVISDEFIDGFPGYYSAEFMVLKDGPVKAIKDLKGRVVAVNVRGGGTDMALRAIARKEGLQEKRDYTELEVAFANMKAVLLDRKADLIGLGVPAMSADSALRGVASTLFTQRDSLGPTAQVIWVARAGFLEKNRSTMLDFMEDALRSRRFYTDPANHREVVDIVAGVTKLPPQQLESWLFTKNDFYRDPNGILDPAVLQDNIDKMVELGFLKSGIDVRNYMDLSIVREAGARLN
ncbi:MAG: ABC transporter substrate-binding protein [Xanthobacteraceae bacterium]|jgi:NitT/TauT family transport system substrate-binding protein